MLKIRDLGINIIPATVRRPDIRLGAGLGMPAAHGHAEPYLLYEDTSETCGTDSCICQKPPGKPGKKPAKKPATKPSKKAPSKKPSKKGYRATGFSGVVVAHLKRELEEQLRSEQ